MLNAGQLSSFFKKWWLPLLFCVVLPTAVVGNVIQRHSQFSPIDEGAHFDYVERLYSRGIPALGDRMLTSSMREMACRGTALEGIITPPCDAKKFPYDQWPGGAYQYQSQQPPLYYAVTAPVAKAIDVVIGRGILGSIRLVSMLWLIGGLLLMWKTAALLGISRLTTAAGLMLVGLAPTVVYYSAIVTNDAAGIFFGALVCYLAALAHVRQRSYAKYAIAIGVAAALSKISCVLPPVIIGAALTLVSLQQSGGISTLRSVDSLRTWWNSTSGKTYARTGTALLASSIAATLAWVVYFNATATIAPETLPTFDVMRAPGFQFTTILNQAMTFFAPFTDSYQPFQFWNTSVFDILHRMSMYALVAGCAAGVFVASRKWWSAIGPLVLAGLYAGGVVIGIGIWRTYDINPGVSGRYALPMVPILVLILCAGIQRATAQKVFALGAFAFSAMSVWMIIQTPLV